jgi:hypothetical protein
MRISVEVDEETLKAVMALTGESNKSPALSKAITEFVNRRKAREFGRLIRESAFDYGEDLSGEEDPGNPVPPLGS